MSIKIRPAAAQPEMITAAQPSEPVNPAPPAPKRQPQNPVENPATEYPDDAKPDPDRDPDIPEHPGPPLNDPESPRTPPLIDPEHPPGR